MSERIVVAKFGGTSVADAAQLRKISTIIRNNPERRFIVVSAPGKRFPEDIKVTDLLYLNTRMATPPRNGVRGDITAGVTKTRA